MTVTIEIANDSQDFADETIECQSVFSPLNELFCSLHVLLKPEGHGLMTSWAAKLKRQMPQRLLNELNYFAPLYLDNIPNSIVEELVTEPLSLDKQLADLGASLFTKKHGCLIGELKHAFEGSQLIKDLRADENLVYLKLFAFLREFNDTYFQPLAREKALLAKLHSAADKQRDYLKSHNFENFISTIDPNQIYWNAHSIKIETKRTEHYVITPKDKLYFMPSAVTWPFVRINRLKQGITITYNVNERTMGNFSKLEMAEMFKVLSDPIRIEVLNYLNQGPKTPKNLAQLLSISEPAMSHHLNLLRERGLVTKKREGKFVFYTPTSKVVSLIPSFYSNLT